MVNVKLYGQKTSTYEYVKMLLMKRAQKANVSINLQELDKIEDFVRDDVHSIPTIKVNDHISLEYSDSPHMKDYLQKVFIKILKEENFGTMKKIIVPTDFSKVSMNAIAYACGLAKSFDSVIKITHVYMPQTTDIVNNNYYDPKWEKDKERKLNKLVSDLKANNLNDSETGFLIDAEFLVGAPGEKLASHINNHEEEIFTVMGSTGESGTMKRLFGSVSTDIIKLTHHPTFVIPEGAEYSSYKNIAIALDQINIDQRTIFWLTRFAKRYDANIHLVHVDHDEEYYPLEEALNTAKNHYPKSKLSIYTLQSNNIVVALDEFIADKKIDLLIMTRGERGFLKALFHHSITKEMSQKSQIPLLIIHNHSK